MKLAKKDPKYVVYLKNKKEHDDIIRDLRGRLIKLGPIREPDPYAQPKPRVRMPKIPKSQFYRFRETPFDANTKSEKLLAFERGEKSFKTNELDELGPSLIKDPSQKPDDDGIKVEEAKSSKGIRVAIKKVRADSLKNQTKKPKGFWQEIWDRTIDELEKR